MSYIGKEPADSFISFAKQDFTTSATTSYTLDNAVTNENEIALFINFVRQEPTTAYTASGTTLTLTSATTSSDDMYCVYLGQAKQTVNAPDGSVGSSQVAASIITGQTAETSIATDDTVLIHDTSAGALRKMTRANFVSGVGGDNTPAFHVYNNTDQNISNTTETQVVFNTEVADTDNAFSSNAFTVPTGKGGLYFIYFQLTYATGTDGTFQHTLKINGSYDANSGFRTNGMNDYYDTNMYGRIINLSAGDVLTVITYQSTGGTANISSSENRSVFGGYKIIE